MIETRGIKIDLDKLESIKEWSISQNIKEVQAYLKFVNYNKKFIRDFFQKALPLINLTKKDKKWQWIKSKQQAFEELKWACLENSMLKMINTTKSIRIETNASNLIISACLNQNNEGKYHSMTYYLKKLFLTKQNYDIANKELLIIVVVLQYWRIYAKDCSKFNIYTNHKNLLNFITTKKLNKRQVKWFELLKKYKFKIHCTSRKENERANVLSRKCDYMKIKEIFDKNILQVNKDETL